MCKQLFKKIINFILQRRHIAALFGSICTAIMHSHRITLSIAMVAMVNNNPTMSANKDSNVTEACPAYHANTTSDKQFRGEFDWSPALQGYILSAGYLGYFLAQIPGGILAKAYGSKKPLTFALFITSACNLLSPVAARASPYLLLTLALIRGLGQGLKFPALFVLMAKWFPKDERGVLGAFIFIGYPIGIVITGILGGKLCELEFLGGWPLIFYVFGLLSTIAAVLFTIYYHDSPEEDPRISEAELKHIQNNLEKRESSQCPPIPWLKMLLSGPTLSLVIAMFGSYWINLHFVTVHSIYLGTILNLPIKENGLLSAAPFILQIVAGLLTSYSSHKTKRFDVDRQRRGVNSFSFLLMLAGLLGVYFSKCSIVLNEVFSHLAMFGNGFVGGGCLIAAVDMTPTFCGPLTGYASTMASLAGFLAPIVPGILTNEEQSLTQWGKVFLILIGICLVSGLTFQLFGSAKIQPYDPLFRKRSEDTKEEQEGDKSESTTTVSRF